MKTQIALSIRQPWAWLILNGGKDIENRTWPTKFRGKVLIHAGKTMTKDDYNSCVFFCSALPFEIKDFPTFESLRSQMGGIVGEVEIVDCVTETASPWFVGDYGFRLSNPKPLPFTPAKGALGFFKL